MPKNAFEKNRREIKKRFPQSAAGAFCVFFTTYLLILKKIIEQKENSRRRKLYAFCCFVRKNGYIFMKLQNISKVINSDLSCEA